MISLDSLVEDELPIQQSVVDYKKSQKQRKVLAYLYTYGTCTLANLANLLHTSVPSVTTLVDELIQAGWVSNMGPAIGNNGRRPVLFGLDTKRNLVAVIDVSIHDTKILFMDAQRNIVFREEYNLRLNDNTLFLTTLVDFFSTALTDSQLAEENIVAVGISMPGLIDARRDMNLTYKKLNQTDESLTKWFSAQINKPVYLINDTKATVLGESRFGGAQGKKQVLSINIDWGIGLGIIINGEMFHGASGFAGELGHIQVDPEGELCYCGKIGCLNTCTSASALVQRVQREISAGQISKLAIYKNAVEQISIDQLIDAAHQGDSYAIDVLHEAGFQLGKGLAIAINLFNPEIIIIDGVLTNAANFILHTIEQAINKYCLGDFRNDMTIELTQLNGSAKWLGTHAYVMENIFSTY